MAVRKPFLLRIDPDLWSELESWAKDELRSVNGQIEFLLKLAVLRRKKGGRPDASPPEATASTGPEEPAVESGGASEEPPPPAESEDIWRL